MVKHTYKPLAVRPEVYELVIIKCIDEYVKRHPELREINITANKIVYELARYFLENEF